MPPLELEDVKKAFKDGIEEYSQKVKATVDEAVKPVSESVEKLGERVEKIEKLPIADKQVNSNFISEKYRGRELGNMGRGLAELAAKHPGRYAIFGNPEKLHEYKKFMVDVALALGKGDQQAKQRLYEISQKVGLNEATGSQGGYLVPTEYEWDLIQLVREDSFLLREATLIPMSSNQLVVPKEATLAAVYWVAEGADKTESDPTFGQLTLTAKKLVGLTNPMSDEFLEDAAVDIPTMLTEQFRYAIQQELDNQALNGTGDPVSGVLTAAAGYSVVMGAGSTAFSSVVAETFLNAIRKLAASDAAVAKWVFGKDVNYYVGAIKDSTGRFIYSDPSAGIPATLWGRPVIQSSQAPDEADSGTGKGFAVLGNWKQFYVGVRKGTFTLESDPYSYFKKDQTRFRLVTRWALAIARSTAFVRIVTA